MNHQFIFAVVALSLSLTLLLSLSGVPQRFMNQDSLDEQVEQVHPLYLRRATQFSYPFPNPYSHIVSGTPIKCSDCTNFFGHIRLRIPFFRDFGICGSSVVSRRVVVTAAHCTNGLFSPSLVKVAIGATNFKDGYEIPIDKMYVHPKWKSKPYDIAVFILKRDIPDHLYNPVKIAKPPSKRAVVYGLGFKNDDRWILDRLSENLNAAIVNIRTSQWCSRKGTKSHEMCATGVGPCTSDSGGPLMIMQKDNSVVMEGQPTVVGITVRVTKGGCTNPKVVHFYTKIADYKSMIDEAIKGDYSSWIEADSSLFDYRQVIASNQYM